MSMFGTTLTQVLQTDPANASISDQLLRLELLALNFSETLSLSPLFNDMDRKISQNDTESRGRLEALAKRVTGWQLSRLAAQGESYRIDVPLAQIESRFGYTHDFGLELKGVSRELRLTLSNPDRVLQTVDVNIDIVTDQPTSPAEARMIVRAFTLSYYDFPLIDNTRLSRDQRLAVVLVDYHENDECPIAEMETIACYRATLEVVVFPGSVATQREAPTLQEVVNNLDSLLVDPTPQ
jgi:hypothetical protein